MSTQRKNSEQDPKHRSPKFNFSKNRFALFFLISIFVILGFYLLNTGQRVGQSIPYSTFIGYLKEGQIERVQIVGQSKVEGVLKRSNARFQTNIPYFDDNLLPLLQENNVEYTGIDPPTSLLQIVLNFIPWLVVFFFAWFTFRQIQGSGNRAFMFGKSSPKRYQEGDSNKITFKDIAGLVEAKYELQEVVEFLKNPERFIKIGARIPKGVLLVGMPGTGKTLLARACAGEADVSFFHMSGSDFVEMFVGVGASRVRDLFSIGRRHAPCVIFIDELDAVGRTRGAGYGGGHDEREQTLNQMLVEMDGFDTKEGVILLAATNRPDVLDPALLRSGRFDRQVYVDLPDQKERKEILQLHAKKVSMGKNVDLTLLSRAMPGASGAELANLVNEAALFAGRRHAKHVDQNDFEEARDKIIMGLARKSRVFTEEERFKIAIHESGHALIHYYLDHADPLHKVTIIPRGQALGVAFSLPQKDNYSKAKSYMEDRIVICFGGYVAETLFFNETSTGVKNDLKQASEIARKMVLEWGMSDLGPITFGQEDEPIFLGKEIATHKDYSEDTAQKIDKMIQGILYAGHERCRVILSEQKDQVRKLADELIRRETLSDIEIRKLFAFDTQEKEEPTVS